MGIRSHLFQTSRIQCGLTRSRHSVLDGEIVCLDRKGRPQFNDLLFRRGKPCFFAFDLLYADSKDWRRDSLVQRKAALRQMIHRLPADSRTRFADHVGRSGMALFERVCKLDLEGIVAKYKFGPYGADGNALSTWYKIRNRGYSQMVGREKLFEREHHKEPVPGWHACDLACAEEATSERHISK